MFFIRSLGKALESQREALCPASPGPRAVTRPSGQQDKGDLVWGGQRARRGHADRGRMGWVCAFRSGWPVGLSRDRSDVPVQTKLHTQPSTGETSQRAHGLGDEPSCRQGNMFSSPTAQKYTDTPLLHRGKVPLWDVSTLQRGIPRGGTRTAPSFSGGVPKSRDLV